MTSHEKIELEFYSSPESLKDLENIFVTLTSNLDIETQDLARIKLCFYESVTNAIRHGNQFDPKKKIYITRAFLPSKIEFYIRDEGKGFDLDNIKNPLEEENINKPCGRGVFFIKQFCKSTIYCNKRKVLKLEFEI